MKIFIIKKKKFKIVNVKQQVKTITGRIKKNYWTFTILLYNEKNTVSIIKSLTKIPVQIA